MIKENSGGFGMRFVCNLSPEEMRERKEEIIRNFLDKWEFEWDISLDKEGETPVQCASLNDFWSYFVTFH
ncbi:MAG: hypothetical protein J1E81_10325 [Eubacterium sp.]|nr:hypothetical protein [Eubacterium sp.]